MPRFAVSPVAEALAQSLYFAGLDADAREAMTRISTLRSFAAGERVFDQGEAATHFYVILHGRVKIYQSGTEGREMILHLFGPQDIFAEVPVFGRVRSYPASALCVEDTRLLAVQAEGFRELAARQPEMLLRMLMLFANRLRHFSALVEDLSLRNVDARLARYLLSLQENTGSPPEAGNVPARTRLHVSRKTLAAVLGTIPETLSRTLRKLGEQGWIAVDGDDILLLDVAALTALAGLD